jgi:hypothetical protein
MALRAKKPAVVAKRLKVIVLGPPAVGKTTFGVQFPNNYIFNGERGCDNYADLINNNNSQILQPEDGANDLKVVIEQLDELAKVTHDFRTVMLDNGTRLYDNALEQGEKLLGTEFGRHYGYADKMFRRMFNKLMALDMNVVVVSHWKATKSTAQGQVVDTGHTFDGWKSLDRDFDLALELSFKGGKRMARITKTRIATFPLGEEFEWSYEAVRNRYEAFAGEGIISRPSGATPLATPEQVAEIRSLMEVVRVPADWEARVFTRANVEEWDDMKQDEIGKCIAYCRGLLPPPGKMETQVAASLAFPAELRADAKTPQQIAAAVPGLTTGETLKSPLPDGEPKRRGRPKATAAGSNPGEQTLPQAPPDPKPAAAATSGSTPSAPAPSSVAPPASAAAPSKTGGSTTPVLDRSSSQEDQITDVEEHEPLFEEEIIPPAPPAKKPEPEEPKRQSVLDHSPYLKFVDLGNDLVEGEVNDDDFNDYIMFLATKFGFYAQDKAVELCQKRRASSFTTPDRSGNFARRRSQLIAAVALGRLTPAGVVVPPITPEELKLLGLPTK